MVTGTGSGGSTGSASDATRGTGLPGTVVLIGPPGAGRSTVGALLASRFDAPFIDTDELVEQLEARSVGDIFVDSGEQHFRAVEARACAQALGRPGSVIALGSGAVLDAQTAAALARYTVVFLDVGLRDASRRSGFDQGAALLALNPRGRWLRLMQERRPVYEALATHRVDTDGRTAQEVTDEVAALLTQGDPA